DAFTHHWLVYYLSIIIIVSILDIHSFCLGLFWIIIILFRK
ncbi:unnamed protein product, partial [Linum tenue]